MYQALYRKWRPKTFDDIVGQEHISETLKNQITSGHLSHAYLFVGTRGTGKTTSAKILAKAINCQTPVNGNPCNKCAACIGIDNGSILDVLELDAASNNGVDNVRALREEAIFTPVDVKKRVYIIDEVHMLSAAAFNALLKILEEPPEHLVFILATTEFYKVPATILSRCQRYTFKRILPHMISERLTYVAQQEGLTLTEDAALQLSRMSDGSLRDALSLLDQCAATPYIDAAQVSSAIGLAENDEIAQLLRAVAQQDMTQAFLILDKLYMAGKVMSSVIEALAHLIRDTLVRTMMSEGGTGLLSGLFDTAVLEEMTGLMSTDTLIASLDMLRETMLEFTKNGGGRLTAELCLMRMVQLASGIVAKPVSTSFAPPAELRPVTVQQSPAQFSAASVSAPAPEPARHSAPVPVAAVPPPPPQVTQASTSSVATPSDSAAWNSMLPALRDKIDPGAYAFLADPALTTVHLAGNTLTIQAKNPFAATMLGAQPVIAAIKEVATATLHTPCVVTVTVDNGDKSGGNTKKVDMLQAKFPNIVQVEE